MQFSKTSPPKLEKVAKNPVEKIASNPVTSVAVMVSSALSLSYFLSGICKRCRQKEISLTFENLLIILPALPQKLVGDFFNLFFRREIWREICGIFSDPQSKGSEFSGEIPEHFS